MTDGTDGGGDDGDDGNASAGSASYVLGVRFRLEPAAAGVSVEPAAFETTLFRAADPPGTDGWLFFRDNLWRGELNDPAHVRDLAAEVLDVPVVAVDFRELRTDEAYLDALKAAIADDLALFNADSTAEVISKYLGSSIRVVE